MHSSIPFSTALALCLSTTITALSLPDLSNLDSRADDTVKVTFCNGVPNDRDPKGCFYGFNIPSGACYDFEAPFRKEGQIHNVEQGYDVPNTDDPKMKGLAPNLFFVGSGNPDSTVCELHEGAGCKIGLYKHEDGQYHRHKWQTGITKHVFGDPPMDWQGPGAGFFGPRSFICWKNGVPKERQTPWVNIACGKEPNDPTFATDEDCK